MMDPGDGECPLVVEDIGKSFNNPNGGGDGLLVLDHVNIRVRSGQIVCILGPSGCGKSTLLNIIAGFERPTSGCVWVNGRKVTRPGSDRGVVFQEDALFPWLTVRENIGYGLVRAGRSRQEIREKVGRFVHRVGLDDFSEFYPDQLSGGMKQRVALARVLVNEPDILLMDEPFASLDAMTRAAIQNLLLNVWGSMPRTILFVTHDMDEALTLSENIYVMTSGPGRILEAVPVPLPRPRTVEMMSTPEYLAIKLKLVTLLDRAMAGLRLHRIDPQC